MRAPLAGDGIVLVIVVARVPRAHQALEVVGRAADIRDVDVRRLLQADVEEGGLHAGEYAFDPALVDVAGNAALALAFDVKLGKEPTFHQRDAGLRPVRVNYE